MFKLQYSSTSDFPRKWPGPPGLVVGARGSCGQLLTVEAFIKNAASRPDLTIFTGNHGPFPHEHWAFLWKKSGKNHPRTYESYDR